MPQVAVYKGRKYKLKFLGQTKYGKRAQLAFLDGSKTFWVPADSISDIEEKPSASERIYGKGRGGPVVKCRECGGLKAPGDPCGEPCD